MNIRDNRGIVLISAYIAVALLMILGGLFYWRSYNENKLALRHKFSAQAIAIAEAGAERAIYDLQNDFTANPAGGWRDGEINGISTPDGPDDTKYYTFYADMAFGDGTYSIDLRNVMGKSDHIFIRSTGTVEGVSRAIEVYLRMEEISIWNNVIFAGSGSPAGVLVNGNVDIRGSVHLLGENLTSDKTALALSGDANVGNNYIDLPANFTNRIPALETTVVDGEVVETLNAKLRVKHGNVKIDGSATVGDVNVLSDSFKEWINGSYVTDGFTGDQGDSHVYSDNGTNHGYDLGDKISMPSLSDQYDVYPTYMDYLKANAHVVSAPADLAILANIDPTSSFTYSGANGTISMDGAGNMFVDGIVYIDGGGIGMNKKGALKEIQYTGTGSIVTTGDVGINVTLLTAGANSYPTNIIGVMTPGEITFNSAQIDVMGLFYGETQITSVCQTDVAGTFVSNYFDMGTDVPSIFQVPQTARNLPPGMIGSDSIWISDVVVWREVPPLP